MMHHENHTCKRCKKELGVALTTTNASRAKMVVWLECDNCEHVTEITWTSNSRFGEDPNQVPLFPPIEKL